MKIEIPAHIAKNIKGSGCVENGDRPYSYGYKAMWLQEIIDQKGVIVRLKIVSIQVHDLEVGRKLIDEFPFEENELQTKKLRAISMRLPKGQNFN